MSRVKTVAGYLPILSSAYLLGIVGALLFHVGRSRHLDFSHVANDVDNLLESSLGVVLGLYSMMLAVAVLVLTNIALFYVKRPNRLVCSWWLIVAADIGLIYLFSGANIFGLAKSFHSRCFILTWGFTWLLHYLVPNEIALPSLYRHQFANLLLFVAYELLHMGSTYLASYVEACVTLLCAGGLMFFVTAYFQWKKYWHSMSDCICGPQWMIVCAVLFLTMPFELASIFGARSFVFTVLKAIIGRVVLLGLGVWIGACLVQVKSLGFSLCDLVLPTYFYVYLMASNLPERVGLVLVTGHFIHYAAVVRDIQESYLTGYVDKPDKGQKYDLPKYPLSTLNYITVMYAVAELFFHLNYMVKGWERPSDSLLYAPFDDLCTSCGYFGTLLQVMGFLGIIVIYILVVFCEFQCRHQNLVDQDNPMSPKTLRNTYEAHEICGDGLEFVFTVVMKLFVIGGLASFAAALSQGSWMPGYDHRILLFEFSCISMMLLIGYAVRHYDKRAVVGRGIFNGPLDVVDDPKIHIAGCACGQHGSTIVTELHQTVHQVTVLTSIRPPKTYKSSFLLGVCLSVCWFILWWTVLSKKDGLYPHVTLLPQVEASLFGVPWGKYWKTHTHIVPDLVAAVVYASQFWLNPLLGVWSFYTIFAHMWRRLVMKTEGDPHFESKMRKAGAYWVGFGFVNMISSFTQYLLPCAPPWFVDDVYTPGFREFIAQHGNAAGLLRVDRFLGVPFFEDIYRASPVVFGAFPSTHCAYPLLLLFFPTQRLKATRLVYALTMVWASVYLQHHYMIDGMGGYFYAYLSFRIFMHPLSRKPEEVKRCRAHSNVDLDDYYSPTEDDFVGLTPHELNHRNRSGLFKGKADSIPPFDLLSPPGQVLSAPTATAKELLFKDDGFLV